MDESCCVIIATLLMLYIINGEYFLSTITIYERSDLFFLRSDN